MNSKKRKAFRKALPLYIMAQYNELAESKLDENENVVYFVNGEAADEDAFTAVINAQNEKADVTFVPATAENLALYLTIE